MDLRVFLPVFSTLFIDERGDKTQIANLLSSKTDKQHAYRIRRISLYPCYHIRNWSYNKFHVSSGCKLQLSPRGELVLALLVQAFRQLLRQRLLRKAKIERG
jgi:hypothetical protein